MVELYEVNKKSVQFYISHILGAGKLCAYKIVSFGLQHNGMLCILEYLNRNRLGFAEFKFC